MEHREDVTRFAAVDRQMAPGFFITFLDAGNALEDIKSVKRVMLAQLELHDGVSLLDVGCGTGDDVWGLARVVGPRGRVVGVDVSSAMIAEAKKRHATSELPVEFVEGEAQDLAFPEASFDRCRTERMLMHLNAPARASRDGARDAPRGKGRGVRF
jgi:ubiquinone/menaquinone biosynthesis C-methylase UbiE